MHYLNELPYLINRFLQSQDLPPGVVAKQLSRCVKRTLRKLMLDEGKLFFEPADHHPSPQPSPLAGERGF
jgi:hypothetical protein